MSSKEDRPLVTFALFAYNQEKYIREAIEGAFSQTYEPLEIILSDDCSDDRTFEIMQEMATGYEGTHEVKVRRNEMNLGTIDHVITVASEANGELLVVAAGDDISFPERTEEICAVWVDKSATAIISNHEKIDDNGNSIIKNVQYEPLARFQNIMESCSSAVRYDGKVRNIPGYCAAYDRKFVADTPISGEKIFNEDALFSYLINFEGRHIEYIDKSLLKVRQAKTSVSARPLRNASLSEINRRERKLKRGCLSNMMFYQYFFDVCRNRGYECFNLIKRQLHRDYMQNKFVVEYYSKPRLARFFSAFTAKRGSERRFAVIRLFGIYGMWGLFRAKALFERNKT